MPARSSELTPSGALAAADLITVVDVSDTTMAASGTNKNRTFAGLVSDVAGAIPDNALAIAKVNGLQTVLDGKETSGAASAAQAAAAADATTKANAAQAAAISAAATDATTKASNAQSAAISAAAADATSKASTAQSAAIAAAATDATTKADAAKARSTHTGTQSADTISDGTANKVFTATEKTKLSGIATSATANDTDANLKNRANHTGTQPASTIAGLPAEIVVCLSDETTAITAGTNKVTFRMPFAMTLTSVKLSATTAPTGATLIVDINEAGASILSTKLSIDAGEKTSATAASAAVISDTGLAADAEITFDFDQVGSTVAGAGIKATLIGTRT